MLHTLPAGLECSSVRLRGTCYMVGGKARHESCYVRPISLTALAMLWGYSYACNRTHTYAHGKLSCTLIPFVIVLEKTFLACNFFFIFFCRSCHCLNPGGVLNAGITIASTKDIHQHVCAAVGHRKQLCN